MKSNKRTLIFLLSGLILLATPMLAAAHGGDSHHRNTRIEKQHSQGQQHASHGWQRPQQKKQFKKPLHSKHWQHKKHRHYVRAHRPAPVPPPRIRSHHRAVSPATVLLGLPPLVVHIDW